ncbi:hypothetical protein BDC45DRAFT_246620 [Circinella umbellata]|nr:hypothetical protein BDC45DRAFT_246620 [Circinella umbellata]
MNFSFDGNFKPKRNINLGGIRSREDKKSLMAKAQADRRAREQERLKLRSAIKIQAFFRGRQEAGIIRQQQRDDLHNLLQQLSNNENINNKSIVQCVQLFLIVYNSGIYDATTTSQLCNIFLSPITKDASNPTKLIQHLFQQQQEKELDMWTWRIILFINKILLPVINTTFANSTTSMTSSDDIQRILEFLAVAMNPDTYATNRNAYLRIITYALVQGHLLKSIHPIIGNSELVNNALDIVTNIIHCQPPYGIAPSNIRQYQEQQQSVIKPVIMSGLFGGGDNGSVTVEQEEKKNDIKLNREFILDLIVQDILSISFFVDKLPPTLSTHYMQELPFDGVLKSIIRLNENNVWKNQDESVANLLVNMTQLAKIQPEAYLKGALDLYAKSIQALLSNISPSYFAEPKSTAFNQQQDSDLSDESDDDDYQNNQDTIMTDVHVQHEQVDPRIKERLEALYDPHHIDLLVRHFINLAAPTTTTEQSFVSSSTTTDTIDIQEISGDMTCLFNTLINQWPSKKDSILNTLLYHRWWSGPKNKSTAIHLAQFFWKAWSNHTYATIIFNDDDRIVDRLSEAIRSLTNNGGGGSKIWATLYLLCEMYARLLLTIGDDEFFDKKSLSNNQLTLQQTIQFSRHLKGPWIWIV